MADSPKIQTIQSMYAAFKGADYDAFTKLCHPDIIWSQNKGFPNGTISHGPQAVIDNVFKSFAGDWDFFTFEIDTYLEAEHDVIVKGAYVGKAKGKDETIRADACHIYTLDEKNLISHFQQYTDTKVIRDAIGW